MQAFLSRRPLFKLSRACFSTSSSAVNNSQDKRVRVIRTVTDDPFFNLAFEESVFNANPSNTNTLFLWRNRPSVIIGRFQNPFKECFMKKLEDDKVELVRRKSGGGAVYHDLGNSIFSFISPDPHTKGIHGPVKDGHNAVLLSALSKLGFKAELSGRNDIQLDGKKISGAAFKKERGMLLHHGTMLLNVDFNALSSYLNPNKAKLLSKGVTSVAARVVNLQSIDPAITHDKFCEALTSAFLEHHGVSASSSQATVETVDHETLRHDRELSSIYEGLRDWEWRFGSTPPFTHEMETRFDWGVMDLCFDVHQGKVTQVTIYSDTLFPVIVEVLQANLTGIPYEAASLSKAIRKSAIALEEVLGQGDKDNAPPVKEYMGQLERWIVDQL